MTCACATEEPRVTLLHWPVCTRLQASPCGESPLPFREVALHRIQAPKSASQTFFVSGFECAVNWKGIQFKTNFFLFLFSSIFSKPKPVLVLFECNIPSNPESVPQQKQDTISWKGKWLNRGPRNHVCERPHGIRSPSVSLY